MLCVYWVRMCIGCGWDVYWVDVWLRNQVTARLFLPECAMKFPKGGCTRVWGPSGM